jgi:hypothetical protein
MAMAAAGLLALAQGCILDLDDLTGGGGAPSSSTSSSSSGGGGAGCAPLDCGCVSGPIAIAAGAPLAGSPNGIVLTGDAVTWADLDGNVIAHVTKAGGAPELVVDTPSPRAVAIAGSTLAWAADDGVHACALPVAMGGDPPYPPAQPACADDHLVSAGMAPGSVRAIAFDGQIAAWSDHGTGAGDGAVRSCSIGSCASTSIALASALVAPEGIAFEDDMAFWTTQGNGNDNGTVFRSPKSAATPSQIAGARVMPTGVAANATDVYWTEWRPDGRVYRCAKQAGYCDQPEDVAPSAPGLARPREIRLTADRVYWTSTDDGSIASCPIEGCGAASPVVHVTGRHGISGLAIGASCLFWTETGDGGGVWKAPR